MEKRTISCPMCSAAIRFNPTQAAEHGRVKCSNCGEWVGVDAEGNPSGADRAKRESSSRVRRIAFEDDDLPSRGPDDTSAAMPLLPETGQQAETVHAAPPRPELSSTQNLSDGISSMIAQELARTPTGRFQAGSDTPQGEGWSQLEHYLRRMQELRASDLHLKVDAPPSYRINGEARSIPLPAISIEQMNAMARECLAAEQYQTLHDSRAVDLSLCLDKTQRFRLNVFYQRGTPSFCVRRIESRIPTLEELFLPKSLAWVTQQKNGLALVAGPTGSGKSTTLAAMIGLINETMHRHIITIEDPIEFAHEDKMSFITQREAGIDVPDFLTGLKDALRQDPDVILIGELRDMEMMETAIAASETGHLVFSTIHAKNCVESLQRILTFFPHDQHEKLRKILSNVLKAIVAQKLIPGITQEHPRVCAIEVMLVNDVIKQCIADADDHRIPNQLRTFVEFGMQDFNMCLIRHVRQGLVSAQVAIAEANNPKELEGLFQT